MEFHEWGGGPSHYVVTPTRVEVELGCDNIENRRKKSLQFCVNNSKTLKQSKRNGIYLVGGGGGKKRLKNHAILHGYRGNTLTETPSNMIKKVREH
jgi:hypothetical protein